MGTNYSIHIGKRTSRGKGKCGFIWAVDPDTLHVLGPHVALVEDEYGGVTSLAEFLEHVAHDEQEFGSIGREFS
jgi:hypothetical protein